VSGTPYPRPGEPAELASAYVMLASEESYTTGALLAVSGKSML
jgi:NAD(P)-dependent dehydrogenase (short-subunit alcohol dehydrogenase family)